MPLRTTRFLASLTVAALLSTGAVRAECLQEIEGENIDAMISKAGGVDPLLAATNAQLAEFDKWFEQMKPALNSGIRQKEIQDLYAQGLLVRDQNLKLRDALICRQGG